jgi:hypothetical protein
MATAPIFFLVLYEPAQETFYGKTLLGRQVVEFHIHSLAAPHKEIAFSSTPRRNPPKVGYNTRLHNLLYDNS